MRRLPFIRRYVFRPPGATFFDRHIHHNYRWLVEQFACSVQSQCDSEVLGSLMARCPGSLLQRSAWTAGQAEGDLAILGIWRKPARLLICRRGRPLHFGQNGHGYYFASLPDGLPPGARAVTDHSACVMTVASTGVYWDRMAVRSHDAQTLITPGRNPFKNPQIFPNLPFPFDQKQRNDMV